jgi:hypothetical protein
MLGKALFPVYFRHYLLRDPTPLVLLDKLAQGHNSLKAYRPNVL